ncbi:hypothetical protein [Nocardia farcinica]|uniref:hypothetical protein n=1 Tax=Nocardia farcinica TaxID=37329 RepID=UPI00245706A7|nr:hypothetical protein [Nocardia farcinica]
MTDHTGIRIRRHDRVAILPGSPARANGHEYGDVQLVGRQWVHVTTNQGRTIQVAAHDLHRINR